MVGHGTRWTLNKCAMDRVVYNSCPWLEVLARIRVEEMVQERSRRRIQRKQKKEL